MLNANLSFVWHHFSELTPDLLYEILALRQSVFIVEQRCPYLDADGLDRHAWHLSGRDETGALIAYLRLVEPGYRFPEPSIGRVVTPPRVRRQGLGLELMREGLRRAQELYPSQANRISAQQYLEDFYRQCGYRRVSDPYDEDGIPHIEMLYPAIPKSA